MIIVKTIKELREQIKKQRVEGRSVGFVPTMGFLHEGHLSLISEAKKQNDILVLSIFVNPLQFGPNEDFDRYPRDFKRDEQLARNAGVDIIFYPSVTEMYPHEPMMTIHVSKGVDVLCGSSRPGHFDGVATVVLKLFQLVQPDRAYFGQKDAQQVAVVRNLVDTFNIPIEIVPCETVREEDGLAKSSRNVYLSDEERKDAPGLYQALLKGRSLLEKKANTNFPVTRTEVIDKIKDELNKQSFGQIDYVDVLSFPRLEAVEKLTGPIILALAYQYEKARLIDNVLVEVDAQKKGV